MFVISAGAHAQSQWGIKSNQQLGGVQFKMRDAPPASASSSRPANQCVIEAGVLAKAAQLRDLSVPEKEARAAIYDDTHRGTAYRPQFVSAVPSAIGRIYAEGWKTPSDVRMAYLKQCDPKTFNWY
ncbi:hypothetical protein WJ63_15865 [Burkholderia pyrrocinia]|nr:hypothetical protein WJ63_15865 [Burkholderia pyrrocinia]